MFFVFGSLENHDNIDIENVQRNFAFFGPDEFTASNIGNSNKLRRDYSKYPPFEYYQWNIISFVIAIGPLFLL